MLVNSPLNSCNAFQIICLMSECFLLVIPGYVSLFHLLVYVIIYIKVYLDKRLGVVQFRTILTENDVVVMVCK